MSVNKLGLNILTGKICTGFARMAKNCRKIKSSPFDISDLHKMDGVLFKFFNFATFFGSLGAASSSVDNNRRGSSCRSLDDSPSLSPSHALVKISPHAMSCIGLGNGGAS